MKAQEVSSSVAVSVLKLGSKRNEYQEYFLGVKAAGA
jgi:hypothetical protein